MATVALACQYCGVTFERPFKSRHAKFCSNSCKAAARNKKQVKMIGGVKNHPLYQSWANMKNRCQNKRNRDFAYYGGRGITVCERWQNFLLFLEDVGERPEGLTLDRIDNDGNYEPSNFRWATKQQQSLNRRPLRRRPQPICEDASQPRL